MTSLASPLAPSLASVIQAGARAALLDTRVCLPARVVSYDAAAHRIDAQPLIKRVVAGEDGEETEEALPQVQRCPVQVLRWAGFVIRCPLAEGDLVTLKICDRDLDAWLAGDGSAAAPETPRIHDLTDSIAEPGVYPWSQAPAGLADGCLVIGREDGSAELRIQPGPPTVVTIDGATVKLGAAATESVLKGDAFMDMFLAHVHLATGPAAPTGTPLLDGAPPTPAQIAALKSAKAKVE